VRRRVCFVVCMYCGGCEMFLLLGAHSTRHVWQGVLLVACTQRAAPSQYHQRPACVAGCSPGGVCTQSSMPYCRHTSGYVLGWQVLFRSQPTHIRCDSIRHMLQSSDISQITDQAAGSVASGVFVYSAVHTISQLAVCGAPFNPCTTSKVGAPSLCHETQKSR
jgi:hypothetical protein